MIDVWEQGRERRSVALEFVGDYDARLILARRQQLFEKANSRLFITSVLDENIQHDAILVDGPPEVLPSTIHFQEDLVQMPCLAGSRSPSSHSIRVGLAEFAT